jgi:NADH-quinone oxidoreductase subunit E
MDTTQVDAILTKYGHRHSEIIGIMQDIQAMDNHLSPEVLRYVSRKMELALARIHDIATFYKAFSLNPRGRHVIKVCCGTACHLGGAKQNLEQFENTLGVSEGKTTPDGLFTLETVNCLGTCALAPVVMVGEEYFDSVDAGKVDRIVSSRQPEHNEVTD